MNAMRETAQRLLSENRTLEIKITLEMIDAALVGIANERDELLEKLSRDSPCSKDEQKLMVMQDIFIEEREKYLLERKRLLEEELNAKATGRPN